MLIPFDMIAVMLYLGYYTESPLADPPTLAHSLATAAACAAAAFAAAAVLNRLALKALRRRAPGGRRRTAGMADLVARAVLVVAYIAALEKSGLPWSAAKAFGWTVSPGSFPIQMAGLAPFVLLFFAVWIPLYGLHRETNYGSWTRRSFIVHKARYNLFMLLAWIPFALLADWFSEFLVVLPALFLLAAWAFPFLLAKAWGCRKITDGAVLDAVRRLEKLAGARFSRVYLWEPGGGMQNAAAVGIFPPFRYLFITPALIRNMSPDELDAVILHELGHVRKKHLLFYLATSLAGINAAVLAGALLPLTGSTERFVVTSLLVLGYFRLVFGWLSRNMERQADLFALEKTGAARNMANALEKLGLGAGNIRLAASWHHLGIAERVDYLRWAERDPEVPRGHNSKVAVMMGMGYLVSLLVVGFMTWVVLEEYSESEWREAPAAAARDPRDETHWRRVMEIMPDSASPRLELAYRLAGKPGKRREAADLAASALLLAGSAEEREAANKLLRELDDDHAP